MQPNVLTRKLNIGAEKMFVDYGVNHYGDTYVVEIVNPIEYASYAEFGHRTRKHKDGIAGRFMMTIAEQELQSIAQKVLENKLKKMLSNISK